MSNKNEKEFAASWWKEMLTRRQANGLIAKIGLASLVVSAVSTTGCGDDETDVERDALDLQKELGWNAGATETTLKLTGRESSDSRKTMDWSNFLAPASLLKAWSPKNAAWQPYVVPTLVQALDQKTLRSAIAPVHTQAMEAAYGRGLGMKEILKKTTNPEGTLIVVDVPGPEAVAYAAALSDVADPIMSFDNWPHPLGVVDSQNTLGALLYYAGEVQEKSAKRSDKAPGLLILDSHRLADYSDADSQFDNRYLAKVPTADKLKGMKVSSILYAVPSSADTKERDDLNEEFADYKDKGINVSMVALSDFTPGTDATDSNATATNGSSYYHRPYYYGGGLMYSPWFFYHYPVYSYYGVPARTSLPSTSLRGRSYTPTRRPTMFSSRNVGGASGVGRARPSGFGRVSTRVGSNGRTSGIRSGRSGSFGRGGSYSG